jgi:hypothetical protein
MDCRDDCKCSEDRQGFGEHADGQGKGPKKTTTAAKAIRAITAIIVFGVPLITGTATLLGYGIHKAYKRMTGRP